MKIFNLGILFFALVLLLQIPASAENLQEITLPGAVRKEGILLDKQPKPQAKPFKITKEYYSLGSKLNKNYIVLKYTIKNITEYPIHIDISNGHSAENAAKKTLNNLNIKSSKAVQLIKFDVSILNSILDNESISLELQPNEEKSFIGLFDSSQSKEVFICPGPYIKAKLHNGETFDFWIK